MKTHTTTATRLLEIVFENHHIETRFEDSVALFEFYGTAAACFILKPKDFAKKHLQKHHLQSIFVDRRSANGVVQKRAALYLTQSGVLAMVMGCRKPAALRFQNYFIDEVIPQLIKYGSYLPGATPAARLTHLHRRWRLERAALLVADAAILESSGLMTLQAFRTEHGIPALDSPAIGRRLQLLAKQDGTAPRLLLVAGHGQVNAWPRELLAAAVNSTPPRLF